MSLILIAGVVLLVLWLRALWHGRRYGKAFNLTTMHRSRRAQLRTARQSGMLAKGAMAQRASALFWKVAGLCLIFLAVRVYATLREAR